MPDGDEATETVPYQFDIQKSTWETWKSTVPNSTPLYVRLRELIDADANGALVDGATIADDTATYELAVDEELWWEWMNVIPPAQQVRERIEFLIQQDVRSSTRASGDGYSDMEERTARLLGERIGRRAQTATQAIDRDDMESVRDHLAKIQDLASTFQE
jgi:hypothetical protein